MSYLSSTRAQVILGCFVASTLVLLFIPAIDIAVSRAFFDGHFYLQTQWWDQAAHRTVGVFLYTSIAAVLGIYVFNRIAKAALWAVDGKKVLYLLLVLALGAGLLVNVVLKDHFGRARPQDIEEFGGTRQFTPAFVIADQCDANCSFPAGDTAGACFSLALAMAFGRRRAMFLASAAFAGAVSILRMASGAHFLSDCIVSFFLMYVAADVLYHYLLLPRAAVQSAAKSALVGP